MTDEENTAVMGMVKQALALGEINDKLSAAMAELTAENKAFREALREIAARLRSDEVQEDGHYVNDYDFAYDQLINIARNTVNRDMRDELGKALT